MVAQTIAWALLLACLIPACAQGLSPPWWVTYDMFQAALRSDRCLNISELAPLPRTTEFRFNVTVCADAPEDKLVGLATFLTVRYDFGGQLFSSRVLDSRGKAVRPIAVKDGEHAMKLAGAALQGNHYFERTAVSSPLPCIDFYWVVLKPEIVQIWVDNLADLWGNINLLAADLFARVFRLEQFGVRATTLKFRDMAPQPRANELQVTAAAGGTAGGSGGSGSRPSRSSEAGSAQPGQQRHGQQQHGQQQQQALPLQASAGHEQQHDAALVAALRQHWQEQQLLRQGLQPAAASSSRQLLAATAEAGAAATPAGSLQGSGGWRTAAKCWALRLAKRMGGDAAVLRAQRWVL